MTSQEQFIAVVRDHLRDGIPPNIIRPIGDVHKDPIEYTPDLADTLARFIQSAEAVDAEIVGVPSESSNRVLDSVIDDIQPTLVAVSGDPECSGVKERLLNAGIDVAPHNDIDAVAEADLGISGSIAAVALTGSVVVDSRQASGRLVSLLPPIHLAMVSIDRIVGTPGDMLRRIPIWYPDGLPSNGRHIPCQANTSHGSQHTDAPFTIRARCVPDRGSTGADLARVRIPRGHFAEDQEEVDAYLTAIVTSMGPRDDLEYQQAGRIARYFLRFRRLGLLEAEALAGDTAEDDGTGRELLALLSSREFADVDREQAARRALNSAMEQDTRIDARIGRSLEQAIIVYYELQRRDPPAGIDETKPILESGV